MTGAPNSATRDGITLFTEAGAPGALDRLLPGAGPWEVELGFGKGRFLLGRAAARPESRFLGIELAGEYFRLCAARLARRRLGNVVLIEGEALALLATALPARFAETIHVYFPDPWPKSRHTRRRLLSPATVDLLVGALKPGGRLQFATDHPAYGRVVEELLQGVSELRVERIAPGWPDGPRTNYEAKYVAEGRPIVRLEATLEGAVRPHPDGLREILVAFGREPGAESKGDLGEGGEVEALSGTAGAGGSA